MTRLTRLISALALGTALALPIAGAQAQGHHGHAGPQGHYGHGFYGRSYGSFSRGERSYWRGGSWNHGWHDGRFAWWWTVGPGWYLYPEPVYPYPLYVPPAVVVQQAPPVPTGLPPATSWYFCDNPQGYYPYVASCNGAWRTVPATPPK